MARVLLLFAHPSLEKSRVNVHLLEAARSVPGVTVNDLYQEYPDFDVDIAREQQLLLDHDLLLVHHPFFWYSTPALVKQWVDLVLQHGWAYGSAGKMLRGKFWLHAITTGGREQAYHEEGHNRFTISQFLNSFEQTARLCGMHYLPAVTLHGTHRLEEKDIHAAKDRYARLLAGVTQAEATSEGLLEMLARHHLQPEGGPA